MTSPSLLPLRPVSGCGWKARQRNCVHLFLPYIVSALFGVECELPVVWFCFGYFEVMISLTRFCWMLGAFVCLKESCLGLLISYFMFFIYINKYLCCNIPT